MCTIPHYCLKYVGNYTQVALKCPIVALVHVSLVNAGLTMPNKSTRERFMFWLDLEHDIDFEVADMITQLKAKRRFTSTIRDGIRLICDLRAGRLDVLFELFPWVQVEFIAGIQPNLVPLEERIYQLEALVKEPVNGSNGHSPKALPAPEIEAPVFDDDEDLVLDIQADTSTNASENFINSMLSLAH
jgi:hypothetical protein